MRHYRENRDAILIRNRDREYGFVPGEYDALLAAQSYVCAICGRPFDDNNKSNKFSSVVDHCHATGKVRGILHRICNTAIGGLEDNPVFIESALRYLKR